MTKWGRVVTQVLALVASLVVIVFGITFAHPVVLVCGIATFIHALQETKA